MIDNAHEPIHKNTLAPWHSAMITVLLLFVMGFFAIRYLNSVPQTPIMIERANLTQAEFTSLQDALQPITQVRFFSANLHHIHQTATKLSWVENAEVNRDWYQGIIVSVIPRKPIANFGSNQMLDANGVVFVPADASVVMNSNLATLYGNPSQSWELMTQMQRINTWFAPLEMTVDDLILTSRHTWIVRFNTGLRVIVDYENTERKLYGAANVLREHFKGQVPQMQSVDLRYKNGFTIAWKNPSVATDSSSQDIR